MQAWREDHVRTQQKAAVHEPRREASEETDPASALILDLRPSEP